MSRSDSKKPLGIILILIGLMIFVLIGSIIMLGITNGFIIGILSEVLFISHIGSLKAEKRRKILFERLTINLKKAKENKK